MKKYMIHIALILLGMGAVYGQSIPLPVFRKQLKVGDSFPTIQVENWLFGTGTTKNLDSNEKVVLLDFFDTYCTACIASMPKLKKIQQEMSDKVRIVLVTWQDKATIERFWKNNAFIREHKIELPLIYADTVLKGYFPHRAIPHVAWIYKGKVQAITHSDFILESNVRSLYKNKKIQLPLKNDFDIRETPLTPAADSSNAFSTIIRFSGYQDGKPASNYSSQLDTITGYYRTSFINQPIFGTYIAIWSRIKKTLFLKTDARISWQVSDSSRYKNFGGSGTGQIWLAQNGICYERFDKKQETDSLQAIRVLNDLNNWLNINVRWTSRSRKAWVIEGKYKPAKVALDGLNMEGTGVLAFYLDLAGKYPVAVDRVNVKKQIILPEFKNLVELNRHLKHYGLKVIEKVADIEVLEFSDRK
ncbi:TlpA family protein disulfide reductase [Sphingobacterium athyrii]|uniref:Thioredoxin domain-containing protein n=1 Tax=Sphingobacterium athyrii TaxID=2152717 RepID=A0A363NZQ5_9SPHI|nr:redoxin family protein [Sphingobacterium athyrii]PUV26289.1 hypothetical protein DCO56_04880 [Sphingobacterium athyrii]